MKLSEIKGERCFDVIADLVEPVAIIASDEKTLELFKKRKVPKGMSPQEFFIQRMRDGLPALLKHHKGELVDIIAVINGVDREEYIADLNMAKLFSDVIDLLNDDDLLGFLS